MMLIRACYGDSRVDAAGKMLPAVAVMLRRC